MKAVAFVFPPTCFFCMKMFLAACFLLMADCSFGASLREYRDFPMGHEGDPMRGKALFFSEDKIGCAKCHSVDGSATKAGPDLMAIGEKFPRRELIQSILEPSSA